MRRGRGKAIGALTSPRPTPFPKRERSGSSGLARTVSGQRAAGNFRQRPARVFGNQWFRVVRGFFQGGPGGGIADVAERHADVALNPPALGPQQRRAGKTRLEAGVV